MIFLLSKERIVDLLFCSSKRLNFVEPFSFVSFLQRGRGAKNLFGIHEHASWRENVPDRLKQSALCIILEVMNGKC
ncbi:hypothetical protein GRAN_1462 [Granulicella sibirica]|uniref:Uncharacterized protein n=1 Tax=Granulicella sibirica TaxID=2479048 RepID=A0A4Q0T5E4_9BACT|nr:hypothetical protein [Granulicella sibirica]RXH58152.1 hypothetical protein GRAN_1462 [Granulicella sibirica]